MKQILKLLPFIRAYRNHPMVKKYKAPAIGCIGCASIVALLFIILIIVLLFQIIGGIDIPGIRTYLTGGAQIENTISAVVTNNNGIIEQIRVALISIVDRLYGIIRGILG